MMMLHLMWNLFKKTGNIEYFIMYKEYERLYKKTQILKKEKIY